ncbi:MFS-type transporter SLC18B1 [Frankliniella occidentalis]|uniref:MFS-type transporter SLC18B1 n=1 Tax=Frankliniella occidentalis TaxID=133901 RepID=A0A6J1SXA3_FRAOC|nr:MFS-type transporter SLC18B1 [Frankliniella occidentalis]XP_026285559.1 MFS-type transporter SLC18B1 [Frankliniella occidentalis]
MESNERKQNLHRRERGVEHTSGRRSRSRKRKISYTSHPRPYARSLSLSTHQLNQNHRDEISQYRLEAPSVQATVATTSIRNFSYQQKLVLTSLVLVDFISFCSMSIMAPFFPKEASLKGMSESLSGFVFGFYALVIFVSSPIFGKILPTVGPRFLFMSGMFLAGCCSILFGALIHIVDQNTFVVFCFLVRGMEAIGASAFTTASYVFVAQIFPDNIGAVMGILETFVGLGMSTGPAIGGLLYTLGGFGLPFYSLGVFMVVFVPINFCLLPSESGFGVDQSSSSLWQLLKVPSVLVTGLVIVVGSNTWGFLDPTLEPHLRQFSLSADQLGLVFLLTSGLYAIFSPIWGLLSDRVNHHWSLMVIGLLLCTVGLVLLGPFPLFAFLPNTLWLNLLALSILGVAMALTLLPTFQGLLDSAVDGGCVDELSTHSLVAGVWACMYSLGEVTGPLLGGFLLQVYGFPICATVMAGATFFTAIFILVFFCTRDAFSHIHHRGSDSKCCSRDSGVSSNGVCDLGVLHDADEDSLLSSGRQSYGTVFPSFQYTQEKVDFYAALSKEERDSERQDVDQVTDVKRTIAMTASGACEV